MRRRGLALSVVLVVAGCGDDPSLDADTLVSGLPAAVVPEAPDLVDDVACPEPEPEVVAQAMTCTASLAGDPIVVDVDVDEEGRVSATVREPLLDLAEVAAEASRRLTDDLGTEVVVDCPGVVVVITVGRRIPCVGEANGTARPMVVEIVDGDGAWRLDFDATGR